MADISTDKVMPYWTVSFKSRTGKSYRIQILKPTGSQNVEMTPADVPFVTNEEGNEDMFVPVKVQTGYINIISSDVALARNIIPTTGGTRTVDLYEITTTGNKLLWQGYVEPQMLSMKIWQGPQKLKIPVECPLSALKYTPFSSQKGTMTIAEMLYGLTADFTRVYIQGTPIGPSTSTTIFTTYSWLGKKIYPSLFTSAGKSKYEVLEEVCKFFGWTCRFKATDLYLIQNRDVDATSGRSLYYIEHYSLNDFPPTGNVASWSEVSLLPSQIADDKTEMIFFAGIKEAIVECDIDDWDESINLPNTDICIAIDDGTIPTVSWHSMGFEYGYEVGYYNSFGGTNGITIGNWRIKGFKTEPTLNKHDSLDVADWEYIFRIHRTARYIEQWVDQTFGTQTEVQDWHDGTLTLINDTAVSFTTAGMLTLKLNTYQTLGFYIKIGNKNFDSTTQTWITSGTATDSVFSQDGAQIPIPSGLTGVMELTIINDLGGNINNTDVICTFNGMSIEFTAQETEVINSNLSSIKKTANSSGKFSEKYNIDVSLCLKEPFIKNAKNLLLNFDETFCNGITNAASAEEQTFNPLQRVADEVAREGSTTGEMVKHCVRNENIGIDYFAPTTLFYSSHLGHYYYPASFNFDWQDDTVKMNLIKRKYENI